MEYTIPWAYIHPDSGNDKEVNIQIDHCAYGENAWQTPASLFTYCTDDALALDKFKLVEGDSLSYNNWCDIDCLLQTITHIAVAYSLNGIKALAHIALGVKHGNSCGTSIAADKILALHNMIIGDPLSLFGGLIMVNFPISGKEASYLREWDTTGKANRLFDGVLAPMFSEEAKQILSRKTGKCRLLENSALAHLDATSLDQAHRFRYVRGGFLQQPNYTYVFDFDDPELECIDYGPAHDRQEEERNLLLAWAVGSTSNSNTITLVKDGYVIANAVGQQDRVGGAALAIERATRSKHNIYGAVAYSDSFFPFPDGIELLISAGVRVILASKGSVNDEKIRDVCRSKGVTLYLIPDKKGRGFFGH